MALLQGRIAAKDVVVKERGAVYASSSQHHDIMAGQGTMCTELLQQVDCLPGKISIVTCLYALFLQGARAPREFLPWVKGTLCRNFKFLLEQFKGTKAIARGHGNHLCCLCEISGMMLYQLQVVKEQKNKSISLENVETFFYSERLSNTIAVYTILP